MGDVSKGEGRTVLFVSHNLTAVSQLCNSGIYLKDGNLIKKDTIKNITDLYLKESEKGSSFFNSDEDRNDKIFFKKITILNSNNELESSFDFNDEIVIDFEINNKAIIKNANIFVTIQDSQQNRVFSAEVQVKENKKNYYLVIEPQFLSAGSYSITSFIHIPQLFRYDELSNVCHFDVIDTGSQFVIHGGYHHGVVYGKFEWK